MEALNAAIRGAADGTGWESQNQIIIRTGIRKPTLIEHRRKCLGIETTIYTPREGASAPSTEPGGEPLEPAVNQAVPETPPTPPPAQPTGEEIVAAAAVVPPRQARPPGTETTGERIRFIADAITLNVWQDRVTVLHLAAKWGCPEDEVERLHRYAAAKVAKSRGSFAAQVETSIASVRAMRDAERQDADRYMKEAEALFKAARRQDTADKDFAQAKRARQMAALARAQQLACQKHLDALTILKPQALTIQIGPTVDPEFQRAWATVRRILDTLHPGASMTVEDGLAAWEDGRLDEWLLAEQGIGSGPTVVVGTTGETVERAA